MSMRIPRRQVLKMAAIVLGSIGVPWFALRQNISSAQQDTLERMILALMPVDDDTPSSVRRSYIEVLEREGRNIEDYNLIISTFEIAYAPYANRDDLSQLRKAERAIEDMLRTDGIRTVLTLLLDEFYAEVIYIPEAHIPIFPQGLYPPYRQSPDWDNYDQPPDSLP